VQYAFRTRPKRGENVCGDAVGVFGNDARRLFAVSDGLGHGPEAHHASTLAMAYLESHWEEDLDQMVWGCHAHVRSTRGLALFLARLTDGPKRSGECTGIGNVECRTVSESKIAPFCRDGIVGHAVRKVTSFQFEHAPGDTFAIFSDGIQSRFDLSAVAGLEPDAAVEEVIQHWSRDYDDATILVIRT
jgi:hypothetical protein